MTHFMTQNVKANFVVGFTDFKTPKGHMVIRGRRDPPFDPKGHCDLYGRFYRVYEPKRSNGQLRSP